VTFVRLDANDDNPQHRAGVGVDINGRATGGRRPMVQGSSAPIQTKSKLESRRLIDGDRGCERGPARLY
jgi:hypothetical protein